MHWQLSVCLGDIRLEEPTRGVPIGSPKEEEIVCEVVDGIQVIVDIIATDVRVGRELAGQVVDDEAKLPGLLWDSVHWNTDYSRQERFRG